MLNVQFRKLLISLLLPFLAAAIGSYFTISEIPGWYEALTKPSFNPPNYLFGPVWTTLYFLMGIAFYDVWVKHPFKSPNWRGGVTFFLLQLILNAGWSIVFFGLHETGIALLVILMLWFLLFLTIVSFWRISKIAGVLLLPYIVWVSFAAILNGAIFLLNL